MFLPFPDDVTPMPGMPPPTQDVTCPKIMEDPAWRSCETGEIVGTEGKDDCLCRIMGNPPPPPKTVSCPETD